MKTVFKKIYFHKYYPVLLLGLHLFILGFAIYFMDHLTGDEIQNLLKKWVVRNLDFNFFLIILSLIFCCQGIFNNIKKIINKKGAYLAVLVLLAFAIAAFVAPRTHRIYYDEDIYANTGQNIAATGQAGFCNYGTFEYGEYNPQWITYNKDPAGWPYLISVVFKLLGTNEFFAFLLNNLIFCGSILVIFFISWSLREDFFTAFVSCLIYALIPHNLTWANTAAAEPSASFLMGLTFLLMAVFFKTRQDRYLFLLTAVIPFACQMRPESFLILPFTIIAFAVFAPGLLIGRKLWTYALLLTIMLSPLLLHFYAVSGKSWGAEGAKFSFLFFKSNLQVNGLYYLDNKTFPVVFTIFALLGFFNARYGIKWRIMILSWFLLFSGIFLFFYAGSYNFGADVRFALVSFMPLALLSGSGAALVRDKIASAVPSLDHALDFPPVFSAAIILFIIIFAFLNFFPLVRTTGEEAWGARYDHFFAKEFINKIPRRSIVLTQNPTMFLLWGQNAIQTYAGLENPDLIQYLMDKYQGRVYFHYNYWCNTKNLRNRRLCRGIEEKYRLEKIAEATEQSYRYGIYKLKLMAGKGSRKNK